MKALRRAIIAASDGGERVLFRACARGLLGLSLLTPAAPITPASDARARLEKLLDDAWEFELREDPIAATSVGDHRYDDRLPSVSLADLARRADARRKLLERARAIDASRLDEAARDSLALFQWQTGDAVRDFEVRRHRFPINADSGFHSDLPQLPSQMPFETTRDYERYLARLDAIPEYFRQNIELLREAVAAGWTLPKAVLAGYEKTIDAHVVDDPRKSRFFAPFAAYPAGVPETDRARLTAAGEKAVRDSVVPAYRALLEFMTKEYLPKARATVGASDMPGGAEYYAYLVRHFTTLDVTPERIHALGLEEVARIRKEMEEVVRRTGYNGGFDGFLRFLRTDPRFYAKTPEELLSRASRIAKTIDGKLPAFFGRLPRQPYGVEPVPAEIAPKYTGGRYVPAPPGGKKAGTYWVNTYALESRPLYVLPSLTLHEAVPGHHLQIALAAELTDLPKFRRFVYVDAFGEGWGLYSERLGVEMGLYADPYDDFGRLTYEMWRACRLVVDTGLHAKGWTRQQAIDYLASHTALSIHECTTETDRYISWPGQALAYKMGELTIRRLRKTAEEALGPKFDVREFHDRILGGGTVTMPILERRIAEWIQKKGSTV
jgi:uncharacterized protein (DUF885 family)